MLRGHSGKFYPDLGPRDESENQSKSTPDVISSVSEKSIKFNNMRKKISHFVRNDARLDSVHFEALCVLGVHPFGSTNFFFAGFAPFLAGLL